MSNHGGKGNPRKLGLRTKNGNYLVSWKKRYTYVDSNGGFIKETTRSEWDWLKGMVSELYFLNIPIEQPLWEFIGEVVEVDDSNHDPERDSNGGCYWYEETKMYFKYKNKYRKLTKRPTSSDFAYTDSGDFVNCYDWLRYEIFNVDIEVSYKGVVSDFDFLGIPLEVVS